MRWRNVLSWIHGLLLISSGKTLSYLPQTRCSSFSSFLWQIHTLYRPLIPLPVTSAQVQWRCGGHKCSVLYERATMVWIGGGKAGLSCGDVGDHVGLFLNLLKWAPPVWSCNQTALMQPQWNEDYDCTLLGCGASRVNGFLGESKDRGPADDPTEMTLQHLKAVNWLCFCHNTAQPELFTDNRLNGSPCCLCLFI